MHNFIIVTAEQLLKMSFKLFHKLSYIYDIVDKKRLPLKMFLSSTDKGLHLRYGISQNSCTYSIINI